MATSSRQSALFGVQDWKKFYQTFRDADFQSYDYESLRKSFIDYLIKNYPENYNDYIESSEFVALLDVIAFMGQSLAFRNDLNTRENFIDTAERRDSVIKLANLVGYVPKRNLAAQGLLKVTGISTTETVLDINGANLSNTVVLWNDPANNIWQEQFNTILNAALVNSQRIGKYGHSQNLLGIRTDEYTINIPSSTIPVVPFSATVDGVSMDFELVNVTSLNREYLYEIPPVPSNQMNILFRSDKLGNGSPNTGYFFYFKQGTLQEVNFSFNEQIENNFKTLEIQDINNDDTWLYQLDNSGAITSIWNQVDNIFTSSTKQNDKSKKIYSVLSASNDQASYIFGDGVFSEIPVGKFRAVVRSSNGLTYSITPDEMTGLVITLDYVSRTNRVETLTFTLSLQHSVTNALRKESLTYIKERAPTQYYSQNRMVNGEDYNNFPFTKYSSIIKSKAVNRTSTGISRNQDLIDPTGKYSTTDIFSDDGVLYKSTNPLTITFNVQNPNSVIEFFNTTLPKYLVSPDILHYYYSDAFKRFTGRFLDEGSSDGFIYWKKSTYLSDKVTGYFYIKNAQNESIPISVGKLTTSNRQYISNGALIKFVAPPGKYFDKNNRLHTGIVTAENNGQKYIWVKIDNVEGDGSNNGLGLLSNGLGPVTLNSYVPNDVYLDPTLENNLQIIPDKFYGEGIIPPISNKFSTTLFNNISNLLNLKISSFGLLFDNTKSTTVERWTITREDQNQSNMIIRFQYSPADEQYIVKLNAISYYFGSVNQVKFLFDNNEKLYDLKTNTNISDKVKVLKTNSNPNYPNDNSMPILNTDYELFVYGQDMNSYGYIDDYAVKVTMIDTLNVATVEPDFYNKLVGVAPTYVFFGDPDTTNNITENGILAATAIRTEYFNKSDIEMNKYEYSLGTIFFAKNENLFFKTMLRPLTTPPIIDLVDVTNSFSLERGKYNIAFQYKKVSKYTSRINPSTANIIDLYLVTQNYYTQYQTWLTDSTDTVQKPEMPTIDELRQSYTELESYKIITDSIILNSVKFKPIFGSKAEYGLRGTIKVIKNPASIASDSQIRVSVLNSLNNYFTLDKWDFGDTFYFSELSAYMHMELAGLISSIVIVPVDTGKTFGDLYQIKSAPDEIFVNGASINDIVVISELNSRTLNQR